MGEVYASYYVHQESIGDLSTCDKWLDIMGDELENLYKQGTIEGARLVVVQSDIDAKDELIWCDYYKITNGRFPFLVTLIQPYE